MHTHTHACAITRANACTPPHCRRCIAIRCQPTVTGRSAGNNSRSLAFEKTVVLAARFFAYKKLLGRAEMQTRDRMYLGRIRSVREISQDDRARIGKTGSLRTPTDRLMENYSIDGKEFKALTSNLVNLNAQGLTTNTFF